MLKYHLRYADFARKIQSEWVHRWLYRSDISFLCAFRHTQKQTHTLNSDHSYITQRIATMNKKHGKIVHKFVPSFVVLNIAKLTFKINYSLVIIHMMHNEIHMLNGSGDN